MGVGGKPSSADRAEGKNYLYRDEAAKALNVKPWRVLKFEAEGELHPHRDGKGNRRYARSEINALAMKLATVAPKAGALEAEVLELVDAGKSDAEIVKALRVPIGSVRALRAAANGDESIPELAAAPPVDTAEQRAFLAQAESDLEASRKRIFAMYEERNRKDRG
jgi:hypothetical protein